MTDTLDDKMCEVCHNAPADLKLNFLKEDEQGKVVEKRTRFTCLECLEKLLEEEAAEAGKTEGDES